MTENATTDDLAARVRRGAELLDRRRPDWAREIAPDRLAMDSCYECILGQIFGWFWDGADELFPLTPENQFCVMGAIDHGFYADLKAHNHVEYPALAELWRREIRSRLEPTP
jgi:hypothetical protein